MTIKQRLDNDIKEAMKAKDNVRRDILRMIKNEINNAEKEALREFSEMEQITVVNRYKKTVIDQIETFGQAGRQEKVAQLQNELEVVNSYLPKQMSEQEVRELISAVIAENGYSGKKDLGNVMKIVAPKTKGAADGKLVNQIATELLG